MFSRLLAVLIGLQLLLACSPGDTSHVPSLPDARPRTYVDGMPLIPDDVNELFDATVGAKHGVKTKTINAAAGSGSAATATAYEVPLTSGYWFVQVPMHVGDRVKSVSVRALGGGLGDGADMNAVFIHGDGLSTPHEVVLSNVPAAWTTYTVNMPGDGYVMLAEDTLSVQFDNLAGANIIISNIFITYDHP